MGKNSDLKNIFHSYYNNVLLGEAVKPTEGGTGSFDKELEALKVALNNPNITPEQKAQVETAIKAREASPQPSPSPSPKASPSPSPKPVENKSNIVPIRTAVETANKQQTPAPQQPAPSTAAYNPKEEYNKLLGRTPNRVDPDSFENIDRFGNDRINPEAAKLKKQVMGASGSVAEDPLVAQAKLAQGKAAINQFTPAGKLEKIQNLNKKPESDFSNWKQSDEDKADKQAGLPEGPTKDAAKQLTATSNEKLQQAITGNSSPSESEKPKKQPVKSSSSNSGSIVDYLSSKGQASDRASRAKLAAQYGIQNYSGTAEQNTQLLNKLKSGEKPQATTPTQAAQTQQPKQKKGMGGIVGGVSKAIGSAGQGVKQATIGTKKPLGGILGGISKGLGSVGKGVKTALVGNQEEAEENWVQQGETEVENVTHEYEKEETPAQYKTEAFIISKFLKALSEKNYHHANIHLNEIIQNKVKKKLFNSIK